MDHTLRIITIEHSVSKEERGVKKFVEQPIEEYIEFGAKNVCNPCIQGVFKNTYY